MLKTHERFASRSNIARHALPPNFFARATAHQTTDIV